MNVRVFLLVLFTFAFMGVWDADRPAAGLAKDATQETPVAASLSMPGYSEHVLSAALPEDPAVPAQETVPLDVQTVLLLVASVPWDSSVQAEVPEPVEAVAEPVIQDAKSDVIELAVDVITNLMSDAIMVQPVASEEIAADEDLGVFVTETEETSVVVDAVHTSEAVPVIADSDVTFGSVTLSQEAAEAFIPLPKNLAAGTWQVMSESSEFYRVTIDKSRAESASKKEGTAAAEEESFSVITTSDGVRWSFIRSFANPRTPGSDRQASTESLGSDAQ